MKNPSLSQITVISIVIVVAILMELGLWNMWNADVAYNMGKNLDSPEIQQYVNAYLYLTSAVEANPDEPVIRDELAFNQAVLASALFTQVSSSTASSITSLTADQKLNLTSPQLGVSTAGLVNQAISNSDKVVAASPDSLPFWKNRTKIFYQLTTVDPKYYASAVDALQRAVKIAPTDAKVHYNLGLVLGKFGDLPTGIKTLEETIALKPDYRDAHYTLGLFYSEIGDKGRSKAQMEYILAKIGPDNDAKKWLNDNVENKTNP